MVLIKNNFLCFLLSFAIFCHSAYCAPFQNGSFEHDSSLFNGSSIDNLNSSEQDLTGWTIEILQGSFVEWKNNQQYDGTYSIALAGSPSQGRVSQIFDTVANRKYLVTYYLYPTSTLGSNANKILATVKSNNNTGTTLHSQTVSPVAPRNTWRQHSFIFKATSTSTYLSFENIVSNNNGSFLDNISVLASPTFDLMNNAAYPDDPSNLKLKSIPGQIMVFDFGFRNTGSVVDNNITGSRHFGLKFEVPPQIAFELDSIVFEDGKQAIIGATGNVATNYTSINNSGVLCCGTTGDIEYSSVGKSGPWTYTPSTSFTSNGKNYDNNVRGIKISPRGIFADGTTSPTGYRVYYKGQIK